MARIVEALESAKGATPATLLVEGTPGIGKTALLDVACELARERGFVVCRVKASPVEREVPFAVVQQLFDHLRDGLPSCGNGEAAPHGYDLIAGHLTGEVDESEEFRVHRAIRDLRRFVAEHARRAPLCLAIDDVQWTDVPSTGSTTSKTEAPTSSCPRLPTPTP